MTTTTATKIDLGASTPEVHFPRGAFDQWRRRGYDLKAIHAELEALRVAVKKATDHRWDNSHFFIDDSYGRPALHFLTGATGTLHLWDATHRRSAGTFDAIPADFAAIVDRASGGAVRCAECGEWFAQGQWRPFSFAGAVCLKDYDPSRHKPPDTRGD